VISEPTGRVPDNLYTNTGIIYNNDLAPFTKHLTVRGMTLMGRDENTDAFMNKVAGAIEEMFPEPQDGDGIDSDLQKSVIRSMYERKASIPFYAGDDNIVWQQGEEAQYEQLESSVSICDVIFEYGG